MMGWQWLHGIARHALEQRVWLTDVSRFLFNPFTIIICLGRSTSVFTTSGILYAVSNAVSGNSVNAMLALGFASYLSIYPALLFIPLVLLCYDRRAQENKSAPSIVPFAVKHFAMLAASVGGLFGLSCLVIGDFWEFLSATYGFQLLVPDLAPNVGLWWYFFIEMFDEFREFFLGVFWLHMACYVGGLTVRLRRQPLFVISALLGVFAVFKPYPSIADASLYFALLPLYRHLFPRKYLSSFLSPVAIIDRIRSNALHVFRSFRTAIRYSAGTSILSLVDLCWIWECQLFLCDHSGLELGTFYPVGRHRFCCASRAVGARQPAAPRKRCQANIARVL